MPNVTNNQIYQDILRQLQISNEIALLDKLEEHGVQYIGGQSMDELYKTLYVKTTNKVGKKVYFDS